MINFISSMLLYIDPAATTVWLPSTTAIVEAVGETAIVCGAKLKRKLAKCLKSIQMQTKK